MMAPQLNLDLRNGIASGGVVCIRHLGVEDKDVVFMNNIIYIVGAVVIAPSYSLVCRSCMALAAKYLIESSVWR
jgi:hypothetical protein